MEQIWGEKWEAFRDRHGDHGRDLALYVGRTVCGLKLLELAPTVGCRRMRPWPWVVKRNAGHLEPDARAQKS